MYNSNGVVLASQCDFSANLSTIGALQIIQDQICIYFGEMGVDEIRLKRDFNSIWVFVKNKVKFLGDLGWNEKYKLNDPLWKQFLDYMSGLLRFDLGPSFKYQGKTVDDFISNGFPYSLITCH